MPREQDGLDGPAWKVDQTSVRAQRAAAREIPPTSGSAADRSEQPRGDSFAVYREPMDVDGNSESDGESASGRTSVRRNSSASADAVQLYGALVSRSNRQTGIAIGQQPVEGVDHFATRKKQVQRGVDRTIIEQALSRQDDVRGGTDAVIAGQMLERAPEVSRVTDRVIFEQADSRRGEIEQKTDQVIAGQIVARVQELRETVDHTIVDQTSSRQHQIAQTINDVITAQLEAQKNDLRDVTSEVVATHLREIFGSPGFSEVVTRAVTEEVGRQVGEIPGTLNLPPLPLGSDVAGTTRLAKSAGLPPLTPSGQTVPHADNPRLQAEQQENIMAADNEQPATGALAPRSAQETMADLIAKMAAMEASISRLQQENAELKAESRVRDKLLSSRFQSGGIDKTLPSGTHAEEEQSRFESLPSRAPLPEPGLARHQLSGHPFGPTGYPPQTSHTNVPQPDPLRTTAGPQSVYSPLPSDQMRESFNTQLQVPTPQSPHDNGRTPAIDIATTTMPAVPVRADYPVELAIRSENRSERELAISLGAHEVVPKLPDGTQTIGEYRWFVPAGTDLRGFPGLPQGVRHDIAVAAPTTLPGQPVQIEKHGWRQGIENGKTFTYQSAETVLNVKDRTGHQQTRPDSTIMRRGGLGSSGQLFQRVDAVKGGQDITPIAHLVNPSEKAALDEAGLGHVHHEATAVAAERARSVPMRAQNNPNLVSYGHQLYPQLAPTIQRYAAGSYSRDTGYHVPPVTYGQARAAGAPLMHQTAVQQVQLPYGPQGQVINPMNHLLPSHSGYGGYGGYGGPAAPVVHHVPTPLPPQSHQILDPRTHALGRG